MRKWLQYVCALLACLLLAQPAALAEECFTIQVDTLDLNRLNSDDYVALSLSSSAQGIRVRKTVTDSSEVAAAVRLTIMQMNSRTLVFDKDYGYQSGTFDSGVIYLPYVSSSTVPYLVTLYAGDYVYALPFMHQQRRMEANSACTVGVRLRDLEPAQGSDWLMGTMVDLNELRAQCSMKVDVCASNSYVVGTAVIRLQNDRLSVELSFRASADVSLEKEKLYVVTDGNVLSSTRAAKLSDSVDVSGADCALVYLDLQLSYDPEGLAAFRYDASAVRSQQRLWENAHQTASIQNVQPETFETEEWTDGWSSGWEDGWSSGW